jgi:hypothetical protein
MNIISSYIIQILTISAVGLLCDLCVSGASRNGKTLENGLKLIISLCICISVIFPITNEIKDLDLSSFSILSELSTPTDLSNNYMLSLTKSQMQKELSEKIFISTGINPLFVRINLYTKQDKNQTIFDFKNISITISKKYITFV